MNLRNEEFKKELLNRTLTFSNNLIDFVLTLPSNFVNDIIRKQLIRSGTSIGANYREACEAESAKDFVHKIRISKKEAKETEYWLELVQKTNQSFVEKIEPLFKEVREFIKIFSVISSKFD